MTCCSINARRSAILFPPFFGQVWERGDPNMRGKKKNAARGEGEREREKAISPLGLLLPLRIPNWRETVSGG